MLEFNRLNCYLCKILWFLLIFRKLIAKSWFLQGFTLLGDIPHTLFLQGFTLLYSNFLRREESSKEASTPSKASPLYGEDATAPPVALTLMYPRPIKGSGCFFIIRTIRSALPLI